MPEPVVLPPRVIRYTFSLNPELTHLQATVCFEGGMPRRLIAIHDDGRARLETAEAWTGEVAHSLPHDGRIDLRGIEEGSCVRYRVDLTPDFGRTPGAPGSYRVGSNLVAPTGLWLWAPEQIDEQTMLLARFVMPEGQHVSTLWPDAGIGDGWLRIDERAFRYLAYVAFGRFEAETIAVPGGCIEATVLDGHLDVDRGDRRRWLGAAARSVARVLGRFPSERTSVLVVPAPFADTPVLFGIVGRGAVPTVALLVGGHAQSDALVRDWTAVHEFTHLASPYVEREEAWITEGLATYYQQVLRAREELLTPEQAWNEMLNGFSRGASEGTGRTLRRECRDMSRSFAFGRVYWSGAAIAFLADVEYRRRSNNHESLDDAMQRAADRRGETMSASELIESLDGGTSGVFAEVTGSWIDSSSFPDVEPVLEWLGVRHGTSGVELVEAPGNRVRDAIMGERRRLAATPSNCRER